ncbi:hypothetical protein K1719_016573 [Acacia pycnantha]|nr:hypothetical protein K1719_016573 [Acacia pycnantha]
MQRAEPPSPRRFHVLLVGTDQETERLIRIQLIHSYYQITPYRTFNSALEFFEKEKFGVDLVLSDVSLKVEEGSNSFEDGYDFIEQIQLLRKNIFLCISDTYAVPKRILEEMKKHRPELSLTRGQVGSHLQKHGVKEKKKQLPQPRMNIANGWNVMTVNQIPPRFDFHLPENSTINSLPHPPLSQMQNPHYDQQRISRPRKYNPNIMNNTLLARQSVQQLW